MTFPLADLKIFTSSLVLCCLIMTCLSMNFFEIFVWGLLSFLNLVFHQIWDITSHYFFKYIFCSTLSPLFWDSGDINSYCPTILFSVLFLSLLKSDHFYWSVIKFTDFLLSSPFCYRAHPVSFLFWLLCFSFLKFSFGSSLYLLFLCWDLFILPSV